MCVCAHMHVHAQGICMCAYACTGVCSCMCACVCMCRCVHKEDILKSIPEKLMLIPKEGSNNGGILGSRHFQPGDSEDA